MRNEQDRELDRQKLRKIEYKLTNLENLTLGVEKSIKTLGNGLTTEVKRLEEVITAFTKDPTWRERTVQWLQSLRGLKGWIKLLTLGAAIVGLVSAWYSLLPRVSLALGPIPDGGYIFNSNISVSNDSVFDLTDVWIGCRLGEILGSGLPSRPPDYWRTVKDTFSTQLKYTRYMSYVVGAGQKVTADSFCAIDNKLSYVDVLLVVHFRYLGIPGRERIFRLTTVKGPNGSLEWMEEPYQENRNEWP